MRSSEWSSQKRCHYNMSKRCHSSPSPCEDTASKWLLVSQEQSPPYNLVVLASGHQTSSLWNCGKINLHCLNQTKLIAPAWEPEPYTSLASLWQSPKVPITGRAAGLEAGGSRHCWPGALLFFEIQRGKNDEMILTHLHI